MVAVEMLALAAGVLGCESKAAPTSPAPTAEPAALPTQPLASAAAAPTPTVASSAASPAASATASITRSSRPTIREWCEAPIAALGFGGMLAGSEVRPCHMLAVREWLLVSCPLSGTRLSKTSDGEENLGKYDHAIPGGGSSATKAEVEVGADPSTPDAIVISLRPGTKAKPTFLYRPHNHPEWIREDSYTFELTADAMSLDDRKLNGGPWPRMEKRDSQPDACKHLDDAPAAADGGATAETPLADLAGIDTEPAEGDWAAEREVRVTGSGALGCKTKVHGSWFWMRCEGKETFSAVDVELGKRPTQTKATVESGVAKLVTPYVEETDVRARLTYGADAGGVRYLHVRWPKGKRPFEVGTVTDAR